jgi:hypothetical protein
MSATALPNVFRANLQGFRWGRGGNPVIASGALLLAGVGLVVPMIGLVAGVGVMLGASLDRLKLRVEALEKMPRVAIAVKSGARIASDG